MEFLSWKGNYAYVDSWFWTANPYFLSLLAIVYLLFVLWLGPKFMEKRKAYDIRRLILGYNLFQVLSCLWIVFRIQAYDFSFKYAWVCDNNDRGSYDEIPEIQRHWFWAGLLVLILRTSEYAETVFYVLRKKQGQVTVLHVFHHIAVTFLLWIHSKYGLERNGGFVIVVNSAVHVVMYLYFILGSFEATKETAKNFKKHMTMFQIVQLLVLLGHGIRMITACNAPIYYILLTPAVAVLVGLFTNFYVRTYVLKTKRKAN